MSMTAVAQGADYLLTGYRSPSTPGIGKRLARDCG